MTLALKQTQKTSKKGVGVQMKRKEVWVEVMNHRE
jgi:hypothetical protein